MPKLKNDEKQKRQPVKSLWIVAGGAILVLLMGIYAALVLVLVPDISAPDFAYTTTCGVDLYDIDNDEVTTQFPDDCTVIHQYDFSPDTARVVYTDSEAALMIAQVQPFEVQDNLSDLGDMSALAWSPDGETIAMWRYLGMPSGQELVLYDVATGNVTSYGTHSLRHPSLSWSLDSDALLFAVDMGADTEIVRYDLITETITQLTDDDHTNRNPVQARNIAIYTRLNTNTYRDELRTLNLETGESLLLFEGRTIHADVSPDGNYASYQATDDNGYPAVYWINLKTMQVTQVTPHEPAPYITNWLPIADYDG